MRKRKITDIIIVLCMIALALSAAIIYIPRIMEYKQSRDSYSDIRNEYVSQPGEEASGTGEAAETEQKRKTGAEKRSHSVEVIEETEQDMEEVSSGKNERFPEAEYVGKKPSFDKVLDSQGFDNKTRKTLNAIKVNHEALLKKNHDYIGWIYIPGTDISYPVVKSKDNKDYLNKSFEKKNSRSGCIFLDANCESLDEGHLILYGHNMRDGSMFAQIKTYISDKGYVKAHPVFWFFTESGTYLYRIFSAHTASPSDRTVFGSQETDYRTKQKWSAAMDYIKKASVIDTDMNITYGDQVMTLATCTSARVDRALVHGKLIAYSGKEA